MQISSQCTKSTDREVRCALHEDVSVERAVCERRQCACAVRRVEKGARVRREAREHATVRARGQLDQLDRDRLH